MARQLSIQRETCAPVASSARKRAGTATLPFASMECRNSPVNTPLPLDLPSRVGVVHHPGVLSLPRLVRSPLLLPTLTHSGPLRGILRHSSATSSPFAHVFRERGRAVSDSSNGMPCDDRRKVKTAGYAALSPSIADSGWSRPHEFTRGTQHLTAQWSGVSANSALWRRLRPS